MGYQFNPLTGNLENTAASGGGGGFNADGTTPLTGNIRPSTPSVGIGISNNHFSTIFVDGMIGDFLSLASTNGLYLNGDATGLFLDTPGEVNLQAEVAGTISANSHTIQNVSDPVNPQDAATRAFVLANSGALPSNLTIANSGSDAYVHSTTGRILLGTNTSTVQVDANGFNAGNHTISSVGTPSATSDAANKAYVDQFTIMSYITGEDVAQGDFCVLVNNGSNVLKVMKATSAAASNASLDTGKWLASGYAIAGVLSGNLVSLQKIGPSPNPANFEVAPGASDVGKSIYLSATTAGSLRLSPPTTSGDVIVCLGRHRSGGYIDIMSPIYMGKVP